jgi:alcohol dehydrogenase (cytochrome c)
LRSYSLAFSCIFAAIIGAAPASARAQPITGADLLSGLANPGRWLTYSGDYSGQRHSPLSQITPANAGTLTEVWTFRTGVSGKFEATPLVIDGIVYATGPNNTAWALDAATGREIWRYQRTLPPQTQLRVCCGMVNRGFAVLGERLFMNTLDAHVIALDMKTGNVLWDLPMPDTRMGNPPPGPPHNVKDKLNDGDAGAEYPNPGFIDAYYPAQGRRNWR